MAENLRRRSDRSPPTQGGPSKIYVSGSENCGEQGPWACYGEASIQENQWGMEACGTETSGKME